MHWQIGCRALATGLALVIAPACFGEPPPANIGSSTGSSTAETMGACPLGSDGCDCLSDGSCDAGLECTQSGKCIEVGCTPGESGCTCNGGLCLGDLECGADDICRSTGPSTSGATSDDGGGTTAADVCAPVGGDGDCAVCAKESCCAPLQECAGDPECACLIDCYQTNPDDPGLCETECGLMGVPAPFDVLLGCVARQCPVCEPDCNVPATAPQCTMCAAEFCCPELAACIDDPACECAETCLATGEKLPEECMADCDAIGNPQLIELQTCAATNQCFTPMRTPCYGL